MIYWYKSTNTDAATADIKEELSYYPGELPAEKIRLVYAGINVEILRS